MPSPRWHSCTTVAELRRQAMERIRAAAAAAIGERGAFHVVLAGGETPRAVYEALAEQGSEWGKWWVWFGDERCLPADDPARNSEMARASLLGRVGIPPAQVRVIPGELGPRAAAADYGRQLDGAPEFDLVLLGLGEDAHTASLFPGADWGESPAAPAALAVEAAPKPPAGRVSLAAWRLSRTRSALFLVAGAGKRAALRAWRNGERVPAAAVRPPAGADVLVERCCLE
ncbi:MAG: 6-phosphogluconolactonase [Rhodocyclaceae bacterium]|nr:6-phosphogluconolactonase [Rhodocyclaceae bacterium]